MNGSVKKIMKIWNRLNDGFSNLKSEYAFKKKLKLELLDRYIYDGYDFTIGVAALLR